jgi:hypothetical protein
VTVSISYHHCGTVILIGRTSQEFFPTEENGYDMSVMPYSEYSRYGANIQSKVELFMTSSGYFLKCKILYLNQFHQVNRLR